MDFTGDGGYEGICEEEMTPPQGSCKKARLDYAERCINCEKAIDMDQKNHSHFCAECNGNLAEKCLRCRLVVDFASPVWSLN